MKVEIKVPPMGESITEAVVGKLLKPSGTAVVSEDEVLELETDKVNQVLYAPSSGTIQWSVQPEETVKIGQVIGWVDSAAQSQTNQPKPSQEATAPAPQAKEAAKETTKEAPVQSPPPPTSIGARQSKENYISSMRSEPVQSHPAPQPAPQKATSPEPVSQQKSSSAERPERRMKLSRIRQVIARRLVDAQHEAAMLTTFNEVDLTQVMDTRARHKESFPKENDGAKLGLLSFFVKATISALKAFPEINASLNGDELTYHDYCDIGIAVGTDKGVIVPVLRNAELLSFAEIERQIEQYAKQAREGKISADSLKGGTFTITNGGVYGSLLSTPILNPPQSAILGLHKIEKRPVVVDDQIVIRPMMYLALSYDHRVVDGKEAVSFLVHIKRALEDLSLLLLNS